jgi:hypothetical protein
LRDRNNNKELNNEDNSNTNTQTAYESTDSLTTASSFKNIIDSLFNYLFFNTKSKLLKEKFDRLVVITRNLMIHNDELNKKLNKSFEKLRLYQQRKFTSDHNLALTPIMNDNENITSTKGHLVSTNNFSHKKNYWNQLNDKENYLNLNLISTNKLRYVFFIQIYQCFLILSVTNK